MEGWIAKAPNVFIGDHFSEVAFEGEIGEISPCLAQNPFSPSQAINK